MAWINPVKERQTFQTYLKMLPKKGKLAWEYNPFKNYRILLEMWEYRGGLYTKEELTASNGRFQFTYIDPEVYPTDPNKGKWLKDSELLEELPIKHLKGELCDFITSELSFSLEHPVNIIPQYSYDGSVNLILNDGYNYPRLINSRFSTTGLNTYEIINRKGDGDTNIYDLGNQFDIDTSLYKRTNLIPKLSLKSIELGGNLKVGNYHFYFKYTDADGNETDFVAESGLVSIFMGGSEPHTIHTGVLNENSTKQVTFILSNIDYAYEYVSVYYSRSYAGVRENEVVSYKKIDKKYLVNNKREATILITGFESDYEVTAEDINVLYNLVDSAKAHATAKDMLFLANVHKPEIPYDELLDLSLRFLPYLKESQYGLVMDLNYNIRSKNKGYYDPKVIYSSVGYWEGDLYRLGIVYLLSNNELSPVFNIRGAVNVGEWQGVDDKQYSKFNYEDNDHNKVAIQYNELDNMVKYPDLSKGEGIQGNCSFENVKGVVSFKALSDTDTIHGIDIRTSPENLEKLRNLGIKGFFFVRLKRMPFTLCLAITIATDNNAHIPTIPTMNGLLPSIMEAAGNTYMSFDQSEAGPVVNYVSEGFMSRYRFKFSKKKDSHWKTIGIICAVSALVVVGVVGSIFTAGTAGVAAGASIATILAAGSSAVAAAGGIILTTTIVAGVALVGAGVAGLVMHNKGRPNIVQFNGRTTEIPSGGVLVETSDSRLIGTDYESRLIIKGGEHNTINAAICPDYEVDPAFYNQIFTGTEFLVKTTTTLGVSMERGNSGYLYFVNNGRHYYIPGYTDLSGLKTEYSSKIQAVPDNTRVVLLGTTKYRSRAGWAEEAWQYESIGVEYKNDFTEINEPGDKSKDDVDENGDPLEVFATWNLVNSDIVRGEYGPYIGISNYYGGPAETINIMIPGYLENNLSDYIQIRMSDNSSFFAISDRIDINDCEEYLEGRSNLINDVNTKKIYSWKVYRGDCYLCQFTHRVNRNFKDPSAPYNDLIVDQKTWRDHYNPNKSEEYSQINLGDVNAVQLGMWVTFRVRSRYNLNIRTLDGSSVDECAAMGHPKGFYPYHGMTTEGTYKSEDSLTYNLGFTANLSKRYNFETPDVPSIKNWFGTRIMYSDILVTDAFRNSFRVFKGTTYRDYTRQYGEITKLINVQDNLLVIFEHGIALAPINEKMVAAQGASGYAYITSKNVLPEDLTIVSESFGTQWPDSVIQTPLRGDVSSIIFGVDTVAKKIWKYQSGTFKIISDFNVLKFLNDNITLSERETTPILGVRNVKTFYNAFKQDVMFTFYDNLNTFEEKVWNLCYNIVLDKFITFYSWVPSFLENIDNIPFSFNRTTSKWISQLGISHAENSFARGITLSNNIYTSSTPKIGTFSLSNIILPTVAKNVTYKYKFELARDIYGNYKYFKIVPENNSEHPEYPDYALYLNDLYENPLISIRDIELTDYSAVVSNRLVNNLYEHLYTELYYRNTAGHAYSDYSTNKLDIPVTPEYFNEAITNRYPIYKNKLGKREAREYPYNKLRLVQLLNVKCTITAEVDDENLTPTLAEYLKGEHTNNLIEIGTYQSIVAVTSDWNLLFLTTDFWKHGLAGIIDITDEIYPTYWYGEQHPFEFECVVAGDSLHHKIFKNLELIANKAEPESFHYQIVGESYDFSLDKENMYFRQEARKALFQYNGADILYDHKFINIDPKQNRKSAELVGYYYERQDTINDIYDSYCRKDLNDSTKNYKYMSGAEIIRNPTRQEYRIWQHAPAVNANNLSSESGLSIIQSNCRYLEDKWYITINPIYVVYKNEYNFNYSDFWQHSTWATAKDGITKLPPITIMNTNIPDAVLERGEIVFPGATGNYTTVLGDTIEYKENALYDLYDLTEWNTGTSWLPLDPTNWLDDSSIAGTNFGIGLNRHEVDLKDKFMKVRVRYSGKDLAIIDTLYTLYEVSFV